MIQIRGRQTSIASIIDFLVTPRAQLAMIIIFSVTVIFAKLGGHGLANYDDCFYAQKAKEILRTGEWMTMHYNNQPAWENAPFFMWLIALSYRIFGVTEFAAKFPSALFGVGTIVLIYYFAKTLFEERTAFLSSCVLATTFLFTRYARRAMMDVTLSFFITLGLLALILAVRRDARWFVLWALCTAVSILMKSVLGFFPLVIGVAFLVLTKRWRLLFGPVVLGAFLLILAVGGAWYLDQTVKFGVPFLQAHFGWLIFTRGFALEPQPWYEHFSYIEDLFTYYWPWIPVLCIGVWIHARKMFAREEALLLILWIAAYLVIMSVMQSRVVWYVMPIFPASAMIIGSTLGEMLNDRRNRIWAAMFALVTLVSGIVLTLTPVQIESERETDIRAIAPYVKQFGSEGADIIGFREDYYGLNNALLFYSDYAGFPIYDRYDSLAARFQTNRKILCILERENLAEARKIVPGVRIVKETGGKILISNR